MAIPGSKDDRERMSFTGHTDGSTPIRRVITEGNWKDIRYDADDSAPDFIGLNETEGAGTAADTWVILKFTYSGSNVTRIQKAYGAWDDRATLF